MGRVGGIAIEKQVKKIGSKCKLRRWNSFLGNEHSKEFWMKSRNLNEKISLLLRSEGRILNCVCLMKASRINNNNKKK